MELLGGPSGRTAGSSLSAGRERNLHRFLDLELDIRIARFLECGGSDALRVGLAFRGKRPFDGARSGLGYLEQPLPSACWAGSGFAALVLRGADSKQRRMLSLIGTLDLR